MVVATLFGEKKKTDDEQHTLTDVIRQREQAATNIR